jgi:acetylornithine deacetylase/succinyl-diaminopimelate desuccinylase-like protein
MWRPQRKTVQHDELRRCLDLVSRDLQPLGFELHQWDTVEGFPVLAAKLAGAGSGRSLTLNGHVDVVPLGDASTWPHDPWTHGPARSLKEDSMDVAPPT